MPKVVDITVLNIDDIPYAVETLPEEVQALVEVYNEWNRKEAEVRDELTRFHAAKETLSRQIVTKVREYIESKKVEEKEESDTTDEAPSVNENENVTD